MNDMIYFAMAGIKQDLAYKARLLGFKIDPEKIYFDDSRAWSLSVPGRTVGANAVKFGAFRNYNGGGCRGPIMNNGREQDGTVELAALFESALLEIEALINEGYEDADPWELPTGVLM